jgi:hypothetical protein
LQNTQYEVSGLPQITPGRMDPAALDALLDERIDWRFKGIPSSLSGLSIRDARDRGPNLFRDGFLPPVTVLDEPALTHNLTTMAALCARHGFAHAPHGKTTMAPQLFARQFEHGAWGQTTANASQLRIYRAFGVSRVILANELVDAAALRWLGGELDADPDFEFWCWVDTERGVELMTAALREAAPSRPVDVLIELGVPGARTGCRDRTAALKVAEAVAASPVLRLTGVASYEGAVSGDATADGLAAVHEHLTELRALALDLAERGHFDGVDQVVVTAGGSSCCRCCAAARTSRTTRGTTSATPRSARTLGSTPRGCDPRCGRGRRSIRARSHGSRSSPPANGTCRTTSTCRCRSCGGRTGSPRS